MRFASLGSGSKGNSTLVEFSGTLLMIDNGFSVKETEKRLRRLAVTAEDVTAILVTHEHADHMMGVSRFSAKYNTPVWASHGTASMFKTTPKSLQCFDSHQAFSIGEIEINPVLVPHDAKEPTQFVFNTLSGQFAMMTDTGSITQHMVEALSACDALLLECNYDLEMLMNGPYPASLKRRVAGDWGHLSNDQAISLLNQLDLTRLQHLVLAHVSEKNNSYERVLDEVSQGALCDRAWLKIIDQQQGLDWQTVIPSEIIKENLHA